MEDIITFSVSCLRFAAFFSCLWSMAALRASSTPSAPPCFLCAAASTFGCSQILRGFRPVSEHAQLLSGLNRGCWGIY